MSTTVSSPSNQNPPMMYPGPGQHPATYPAPTPTQYHTQQMTSPVAPIIQLPQHTYPGQVIQTTSTSAGGQQQSHVIIITQPQPPQQQGPTSLVLGRGHSRCFVGMGITQLILGIACALFNMVYDIVFAAVDGDGSGLIFVSPGIWVGTLFIITGAFGIAIGKRRTGKGMIVTFLVLSIIVTGFTWIIFSLALIAAATDKDQICDYNHHDSRWREWCLIDKKDGINAVLAMAILLEILSFVEFIIAIISAGVSCGALCCTERKPAYTNGAVPYEQLHEAGQLAQSGHQTYGSVDVPAACQPAQNPAQFNSTAQSMQASGYSDNCGNPNEYDTPPAYAQHEKEQVTDDRSESHPPPYEPLQV